MSSQTERLVEMTSAADVTYESGTVHNFNVKFTEWYAKESGKTFIFSFFQGEFVYKYGLRMNDIMSFGEELSCPEFPDNVVLGLKYSDKNPSNNRMTSWDPKVVKNDGYYYVVARRFTIPF